MSTAIRLEAEAKFPYLLAGNQRDHKAWAKRILHRESRGDKELSALQVNVARQAMGIEQPKTKP